MNKNVIKFVKTYPKFLESSLSLSCFWISLNLIMKLSPNSGEMESLLPPGTKDRKLLLLFSYTLSSTSGVEHKMLSSSLIPPLYYF